MKSEIRLVQNVEQARYAIFEFRMNGFVDEEIYLLSQKGSEIPMKELINEHVVSVESIQMHNKMLSLGLEDQEDIGYFQEELEGGLMMVLANHKEGAE